MIRTAPLDRRRFMRAAGIAFLSGLSPRALFALEKADAVFASAFRASDGSYGIATLSERGEILSRDPLPARAHGMAVSHVRACVAAFARRPGTFAMAIDLTRRTAPVLIAAPEEQAKLDFLLLNSRDLLLRFNDNFGGAIGLTAGFSFSDGD